MLGAMCLVALLQLVRLFLLVLPVLVFSAYRLCVLICAVNQPITHTEHTRTHNLQQKILEQTAYQLQQSD